MLRDFFHRFRFSGSSMLIVYFRYFANGSGTRLTMTFSCL